MIKRLRHWLWARYIACNCPYVEGPHLHYRSW